VTLTPTAEFDRACETIGLSLSDAERQALGRYLHLLLETNKQFNLTAVRDPDQAWLRHILDSLSLLPFLQGPRGLSPRESQSDEGADSPGSPASLIDVGTGGGLPAIPIAIARPDVRLTLLEATGKKARFCQTVVDDLGLSNVAIINDRAETLGQQKAHRQKYDLAAARAIGPMRVLLELTLPLVKTGGRVLAMKGRNIETELDEAGDALMTLGAGHVELYEALPGLEDDAVIVEIPKAAATPRAYPRRPGEPKTNPL